MNTQILDCNMEFIEHSIEQTEKAFARCKFIKEGDSDLHNVYFAGATLCLDIHDHRDGSIDVITICHSDETFGYFSGGMRRLLSIKALRALERIMQAQNIHHTPKWLLPTSYTLHGWK